MDRTYFAKAIILKREPFRERDSRVAVYTDRSGYLDLVARGTQNIRSKLAGHIEPFNQADIMVIKGRQWDYLGAAAARNTFKNLKVDYDKNKFGGQLLARATQLIKPGISDDLIYNLLTEYLEFLDKSDLKISAEYLSLSVLLKLLSRLGYQPMLDRCVVCGKGIEVKKVLFCPEKGGVICPSCPSNCYSFIVSREGLDLLKDNNRLTLEKILDKNIKKNIELQGVKIISAFYKYNF
jgi:DNA repair protein RecO (recombination protein O)